MNPINPILFDATANTIQMHLDTHSLMLLGSVCRQTRKLYRPPLMKRMAALYNLDPMAKTDDLVTMFCKKITEETTQLGGGSGDVLVLRKQMRRKVLEDAKSKDFYLFHSPALQVSFVLSATRPLFEACDPAMQSFTAHAVDRMIELGEVNNGRFLHAWEGVKQQWRAMQAPQQAHLIRTLAARVRVIPNLSEHPALPLLQAFAEDKGLGWAHEGLQKGVSAILHHWENPSERTPFTDKLISEIHHIVETMAIPAMQAQHRPILDLMGGAIINVLDCVLEEDFIAVVQKHELDLLRAKIIHFKEIMGGMPIRAQFAIAMGLFNCSLNFSPDPNVPDFEAYRPAYLLQNEFFADDTLPWADRVIPTTCSLLLKTRQELQLAAAGDPQAEFRSAQLWHLGILGYELFEKESPEFEVYCATLLKLQNCSTTEDLVTVVAQHKAQLEQLKLGTIQFIWNRMASFIKSYF